MALDNDATTTTGRPASGRRALGVFCGSRSGTDNSAPDLAREMGVASYPALLVLPGGEAAPQVYDGELKPEAVAWVRVRVS